MPRPVYMLCASSGAEDKLTGLVSHFHILEKFVIGKPDQSNIPKALADPSNLIMPQIRVVSVWMKTETDSEEDEFEYTVEALPPGGEHIKFLAGKFKFSKPLYRIIINIVGRPPSIQEAGVLWMECNIRKLGSETWITQAYPIIIELQGE